MSGERGQGEGEGAVSWEDMLGRWEGGGGRDDAAGGGGGGGGGWECGDREDGGGDEPCEEGSEECDEELHPRCFFFDMVR